ncbi:hypothetical protein M427DRAFT_29545 [Gonapodya prolifera JEL478]|uniref:Uncharacterized protein n=1 Tax=Gonapodya prolifera (strain JEL478) TaxID=1344416 RepID=A0A139APF3_GONPJ|nr:hypothetical protein M427DRAFT_29545 [Gonapodya prolifera JEL478]|eukprot:KXS18637.1 hypothetical protein M427DRAFT_29545 [Gonapodya prolifera JEL478]
MASPLAPPTSTHTDHTAQSPDGLIELSSLLDACKFGDVDSVRQFLDAGAQVDETDQDGNSALMLVFDGDNWVRQLYLDESDESGEQDDWKD